MRLFRSINSATNAGQRLPGSAGASPYHGFALSPTPRSALRTPHWTSAFTMIEIMIVVAIMLIILTMGAPAIYHIWHPESLQKGVKDVVEACSHARARAILNDVVAELRINPEDGPLGIITFPTDEAATEGGGAEFSSGPHPPLEQS